jgi:hypothetical protein
MEIIQSFLSRRNILGFLCYVFLIINSNAADITKNFDYGKVVHNKYINSFFEMEMELYPDWIIQTKEQTEQIAELGKDLLAGDNKNLEAIIEASEVNTANLLAVFKYEQGSPVEFNPSVMVVAENLQNFPGIKSGRDYLFQTKKLLQQSQLKYEYHDKEFRKETINNQGFYLMNLSINFGLEIHQTYYSTIKNGFSISVIITYSDDLQKNELENLIKTIRFH